MNQTFDLKNMGFAEMQNEELEIVDGGGFWSSVGFYIADALCTGGLITTAMTLSTKAY